MDEIASRYDEVPESSQPVAGTINFHPASRISANIDRSLAQVRQALMSPTNRTAQMVIDNVEPPRPSLDNLEILIKQIIDRSNFDGLTEIYVLDLENRKEINFAYEQGNDLDPGVAFTAASTIKIPIMVSSFRRLSEPTPQTAANLMLQMIQNQKILRPTPNGNLFDPNIGPIYITNDLRELGLDNTFLAGHFISARLYFNAI